MNESFRGQRIWITGASSGIGESLARRLIDEGARLVLSARNNASLETIRLLAPDAVDVVAVDVTDREAVMQAASTIQSRLGALDCVILNAGNCEYVDVAEFDPAMFERMMAVNFHGTVYCIEAALPLLKKGNHPYLVGMSSSAAYAGLPRAEAYGASKAAVRYLFQSLDIDLKNEGIDVSVILPGFVQTPLTDKNDFPMPGRISVEKATDAIIKGLAARRPEIAFPWLFTWMLRLAARLPDQIRTRLYSKMVS